MAFEYLLVTHHLAGLGWSANASQSNYPNSDASEADMLTFYGREGWELVIITAEDGAARQYYFKRVKE